MIIDQQEIARFEKRFRTAFVNSLAGFRQAVLVGTRSPEGFTNLAIFNSLIHLGADPALFGFISRPDSVARHTLKNILDTKQYTLNYVSAEHHVKAHQTSARYEKQDSEFDKAGFTEYYHPSFQAPFVAEAVIKIAMKFEQTIDIPLNGTILVIGSITQIEMDDSLLGPDGFVSLSEANILISLGLDAYFVSKELGRLPYAKP